MRSNIFIYLLLSLSSGLAYSSCQEELVDGLVTFDFIEVEGTPSERLVILTPKKVRGWPLLSIDFDYHYGNHFIKTSLGYVPEGDAFKSEVLFPSQFKRSVRVSVSYKSPTSECGLYKQYGY